MVVAVSVAPATSSLGAPPMVVRPSGVHVFLRSIDAGYNGLDKAEVEGAASFSALDSAAPASAIHGPAAVGRGQRKNPGQRDRHCSGV